MAEFTYIQTTEGRLSVAAVIDLDSPARRRLFDESDHILATGALCSHHRDLGPRYPGVSHAGLA